MGARASLLSPALHVDPGGEVGCEVTVHNTGSIVDEFTVTVLGEAAPWAVVEPDTLSLFPGKDGVTRVHFRPPRSADTQSAPIPFAVKVTSKEDDQGSVVEEGVLEVGRFTDVFAELIPRTSRGRRSGSHDLALDNRGNIRVNATLTAKDPDALLAFDLDPPALVAEPDTAAFTKVRAKPRRRFLRGPAKTHPFQILVESDGAAPVTVDGTMLQEPILPAWFPKALAGLALLVVALLALLQGPVKSAAKAAIKQPLADQDKRVGALEKAVTGTTTATTTQGTTSTTVGASAALGEPSDHRLAANAKPGATDTQKFPVPENKLFSLTDIVLQNPAGDIGNLEVRRGDEVILRVNLANFRDLDYHFVSSVVFRNKQDVVLFVQCANPAGGAACTPAAYMAGFVKQV